MPSATIATGSATLLATVALAVVLVLAASKGVHAVTRVLIRHVTVDAIVITEDVHLIAGAEAHVVIATKDVTIVATKIDTNIADMKIDTMVAMNVVMSGAKIGT